MNTFLDDIIDAEQFEKIVDLEERKTSNFCEIVTELGLCPNSDFKYADLKGVDFSQCDLRDFNFKGSDLRNSFGVGVKMPPLENLEGAELEGSVFANFVSTENTLLKRPRVAAEVLRRSHEDSLEQSAWILKVAADKSRDANELSAITTKLFEETAYNSVKNSVLYSSLNFLNLDRFKGFLFHLFATQMGDAETIKGALKLLSKVFPGDADAMMYPLAIISSERNPSLLDVAVQSVYESKFFHENKGVVREYLLAAERVEYRQVLIKRGISKNVRGSWPLLYSLKFAPFLTEVQEVSFLDFAKSITLDVALELSKRAVRRDYVNAAFSNDKKRRGFSFYDEYREVSEKTLSELEVVRGMSLMRRAFENLYVQSGIKFHIEEEVVKMMVSKGSEIKTSADLYKQVEVGKSNRAGWGYAAEFL